MEKTYEKIPPIIPEGCKNCKGHGVEMLDNTYEKKETRDLLVKCVSNYISKND